MVIEEKGRWHVATLAASDGKGRFKSALAHTRWLKGAASATVLCRDACLRIAPDVTADATADGPWAFS